MLNRNRQFIDAEKADIIFQLQLINKRKIEEIESKDQLISLIIIFILFILSLFNFYKIIDGSATLINLGTLFFSLLTCTLFTIFNILER